MVMGVRSAMVSWFFIRPLLILTPFALKTWVEIEANDYLEHYYLRMVIVQLEASH